MQRYILVKKHVWTRYHTRYSFEDSAEDQFKPAQEARNSKPHLIIQYLSSFNLTISKVHTFIFTWASSLLIRHVMAAASKATIPSSSTVNGSISTLNNPKLLRMSYYFTILSPTDTPLFNIAFGTSKGGGDGIARFRFPETAQYMNQFIIHSSLDILEEAQWTNSGM